MANAVLINHPRGLAGLHEDVCVMADSGMPIREAFKQCVSNKAVEIAAPMEGARRDVAVHICDLPLDDQKALMGSDGQLRTLKLVDRVIPIIKQFTTGATDIKMVSENGGQNNADPFVLGFDSAKAQLSNHMRVNSIRVGATVNASSDISQITFFRRFTQVPAPAVSPATGSQYSYLEAPPGFWAGTLTLKVGDAEVIKDLSLSVFNNEELNTRRIGEYILNNGLWIRPNLSVQVNFKFPVAIPNNTWIAVYIGGAYITAIV